MHFSIENEKKQTALNLVSGILTMGIQFAVSFFLSPYIVTNLGEEANGFTQLANNFVNYAMLLTLAFNSMASRFMSVSYHQGDNKRVRQYYSSTVICNIVISLILVPVAISIVINLENLIAIENAQIVDVQTLFACVFLNFFLNLAFSIYCLAMFVKNSIYYQNLINLIRNILNAVLLLTVFSILQPRLYYVSAVAAVLTAISIPIAKGIQKNLMPELKFKFQDFSFSAVQTMISSGIWNTVNQCGQMLMTGLDLLLANLFVSPAAMGMLSIAKTVPAAIISLGTVLNGSFAPALTIEWSKGNNQKVLEQLRSSMKISSVLLSIPMITFCVFGVDFYRLWMPSLDSVQLTILSFLSFMAFVPFAGPQVLYNVFTATNHLKINSIAFITTGFMNIGVVFVCLKFTDLGIFAIAGVSSLLTIIRSIVITAPYAARLLDLEWYEFYKDIGISLVCCGISVIVCSLVRAILALQGWFGMIAMVIIAVVITIVLDALLILTKEEKMVLKMKLKRSKSRG